MLNTKYCKKELSKNIDQKYSFIRHGDTEEPVLIKLEWKQKLTKKYCLIKMKLRDGSTVLFTTNQSNYIIMYTKNNNSTEYKPMTLNMISSNNTNVLIIHFNNPNFIFKISNENEINTCIHRFISNPTSITFGFSVKKIFVSHLKEHWIFKSIQLYLKQVTLTWLPQ